MAKKKSKSANKKSKPDANFPYPTPPHMPGVDWIEVPVRSVSESYDFYMALGFGPRDNKETGPLVAIGGYVVMLKPVDHPVNGQPSGITIQVACDHLERKRQQLTDEGITVSEIARTARGDMAFETIDPDGHAVRFCGPMRLPDDPIIE